MTHRFKEIFDKDAEGYFISKVAFSLPDKITAPAGTRIKGAQFGGVDAIGALENKVIEVEIDEQQNPPVYIIKGVVKHDIDPEDLEALEEFLRNTATPEDLQMAVSRYSGNPSLEKAKRALDVISHVPAFQHDTNHLGLYYDTALKDVIPNFMLKFVPSNRHMIEGSLKAYKEKHQLNNL